MHPHHQARGTPPPRRPRLFAGGRTYISDWEETEIMAKPKAYLGLTLDPKFFTSLSEVFDVKQWTGGGAAPKDVLLKEMADCEAFVGGFGWTAEMMDACPKLRIIASIGVGYDQHDIEAATKRGILVTNTPDVLTDTTADTAFALLMAAARRVTEADRYMREGKWTKPNPLFGFFFGQDVHHATLGIVGLGRIGAAVAKRGHLGFDMKVLYYDVVRRPELEEKYGYKFVDFDTLLAESDFVSLHMPLTKETYHMFGAAQFAKMKRTAIFVNASRGSTVDEKALINALKEGQIAGAGIDVYEKEPTDVDNELFKLPNTALMPHLGSATQATREAMVFMAVNNAKAYCSGQPPISPVNPEVLKNPRKID